MEKMPERRAIRVLEIGAGTGSLTRTVLPVLPSDRSEFTFTDTSPAFLNDAKKMFSDYNFVEYTTFDIEKAPDNQRIDVHGYDLILATNVVHATSDLKNTLSNITRCLSEDGVLMFLEVTNERVTLNNVFGLLKGWWFYQDTDLRPTSALMPRDKWEELLSDVGFRDVDSFVSSEKAEECQQAIFMGKAPLPVEAEASDAESDEEEDVAAQDTYVVMADQGGLAAKVCDELAGNDSVRTITVTPGKSFSEKGDAYTINPLEKDDWSKLIATLNDTGHRITTFLHTWTLDSTPVPDVTLDELEAAQEIGTHSLRTLIQSLAENKPEPAPRIMVVTRGRLSLEGEKLHDISSAPLTGFCRVLGNEHPDWPTVALDLDANGSEFEAKDIAEELTKESEELERAYRGDVRKVNRLQRIKAEEVEMKTSEAIQEDGTPLSYRLEIDKPGVLQNLSLNETPRFDPSEGELEVQVKAGGINFRDVMKALGMYPGNPIDIRWFGDDITGVVTRVGKGVKDLKVGDEVVGMAPYGFRSYVCVNRKHVFRKPGHLSFQEAATLPTVFLTSHYALVHLAQMEKGERVLIHAGTGGVGQAAVQIAKNLGLEIFATAGSDEKRQLLRDQGVDHVMNSRTLDFADDIMRITKGEGIDCVLNSLAGDFIPKSFQCLRRFGRFCEIGKIDVYGNSKFGNGDAEEQH